MDRRRTTVALLLALLLASHASAKSMLFIDGKNSTSAGQQLVYLLKESILKSQLFGLADNKNAANMTIHVQAIDVLNGVAYALVFVIADMYIDSAVATCPTKELADCVPAILAMADSDLTAIRTMPAAVKPPK